MDTPVSVVERVHLVLREVGAHEPDGVNTTQIARAVGLPRPTVHRLLGSLREVGMVDREPDSDRWVVGGELYVLGAVAARRHDVTQYALPVVRELALATGESAFFSVRRGNDTICLLAEDGAFPLRSHVLHEGARFPLGVVSAGLAILAHLDDREIADYLDTVDLTTQFGPAHSRGEVLERVAQTRRHGYAVNPGLVVEGSWGMAAVVFDVADQPRWALTLTGVEHRFSPDRHAELGGLLLRAAHQLSTRIARGAGRR
ncbi:IclR family transcriptional regulator [Nocardioides sp. Bht2]|uniref:IclR family transcriptional regulator n=1 Tax=Nocardioides sp. Bht2 TaxID=3392297 RepID=UPI0039B62186